MDPYTWYQLECGHYGWQNGADILPRNQSTEELPVCVCRPCSEIGPDDNLLSLPKDKIVRRAVVRKITDAYHF